MNIMLQLIIWWHYFVTSLLMFTSVHLQDVIECPKGKYGVRCRQSCFCDWKGARFCHHRTGKCVCTKGYRGELCDEEINECHTNGSQICPEKLTFCENTKGSFKCRCRIGYQKRISTGQCKCCAQGYGTDCKQSCDCLWENTLSCELSTGECLCKPGWEGPRCSRSVDDCLGTPCNEMTCVDLHNSYACICDDNKRYVQGACKECIIDFITHQQQPSCGDWVTLYFLFRLDSDYQNNPRSQPNFVYSIVYNDNPICSVDFHQHAQRVTGNEDFIQKLEPTVEYSFYIEFSIFITGARVNTIKATPASPEYTDKMLLLDSTMTDVSLLFCLKNAHIMNGSNGLGVHTFYMADFAEFELNFTASSTCQSVKVEWKYYKILLSTETESLQLKCIVQKSLIPLSIHTILEKVGLIAISNQDEKKEIVPVSALPMGLYALCATAYVNNDKKLKVSDCTFFKVVPKIKVQIRLTLPVIYIEWPLNQKIAIGGNVTLLTSEKEIQRPRINYILERLSTYGKCSYSTGKDRWTVNYYLQSYLPLMVSSPVKCRMNSTVYVSHTNFKSTFVQEINFVSETTLAVTLKCWQSCDQIVGLKENVVYQVQPIYNDQERKERVLATFLWTMHTNDRQVDTDSILYGDKHSDLMTTKTSTLESNSTYLIQCEYRVELGETVRDGKLKFVVKTQNAPTGEGCTITPTAGLPVKTEFTIQCTGFNESNHCQYRVYQHLFHTNGHGLHVLIGYGNTPEISKLTLSPVKKDNSLQNTSTLIVEVINDLKSSTFYSLMVNFKPWNQNNISDEISDTINKLQIINQEDLRLALNMASLLHLETISSLTEMRTRLQYLFRHFTVKHVDALEMVSWTTLLLAESEIDPEEIELRYSILTLEKIARNLSQTSFINIETTDKLARIQMFATQALLAKLFTWCTNKTDNETDTVRQIEKCLYWGQRLINSVTFIVQVLRNILFLKQEPIQLSTEQLEIQLETHYLNSDTLFNLKTSDGRTNVVLPGKALREDLLRISLDFQVYKKNPYFGLSDNIQQDMPLVQINFFEATLHTVVKSHRLSEPADIFIEFDKSTQNGTHYDVSMQLFEHDSEFRIVRSACIYMSIPASSKEATVLSIVSLAKLQLVIKARYTDIISDFKNMYDEEMLTFPLKTVEVMDTPSGTLNRDNNLIVLPLLQRFQINKNIKFYSILIRLKLHQKVDGLGDTQESLQNTTIVITPYKVSCLHFDRHAQKFLSDKCMLSMFSSLHLLHCQCVVTAFYTGRFIVAPKLINLLDVKLLKFTNNPLVVSMLIALWMIALAAVVHGRRKDKEDQFKTDVTILEDNKEDHSYVYLLCVVTGWFARAYTTSNVFIVMKGSWDNSDTHILCNQKRNLFQSGSEDWFLLTTKGDLGKIHSIEVWTDFSGAHPSWYLKSIYVQNMLTGETWVCKYNSWFSCDFDNTNLKADIPAIEEHEYMRCTFLQLASRTQLSLRNEHLWFGMIAKSPSNVFTRVRRIVTGLTVLQTLMLINLIYFGIEHFDDSQQVLKVLGYNIHVTSIKIGFQSSLFGCIVAFCVAIMFNSIAPQPSLHQSAEDEQELVQTRLQRSRFISTHQVKISSKRKSESSESLSHSEIRVIKRSIFQTEGMDPAHKPTNKSYSSKDEHGNENKDWRSNSLVEPEGDHEIRQVKTSFRLPWWFIYITWINLVSLNIFLAYYIMLYGLSLGYEKNVDWTLAFFTGFLTDILFLQPVKVVLIVFILILILKQKYSLRDAAPVTKHKESLELLYHYKKLNNKIGTKTQKIVYQSPLHSSDFKNVLERLKIESLAIEMIRDFFLYTIFMIFILLLVYGHMDIFARFHQIRFTKHHYLGIYDPLNVNDMEEDLFMEIHDASGMWSYLNDVLLTRLIPNERNNSLKESLYLFGTVRLRQTRVKPDSGACSNLPETIRMIYNTEICIHSMEDGQEENNSFVNSWKVVYEDYVEDLEDSPFVYKSAEQLRTASFSGQRATYSGGGFVANFSRDNIQEARITLDTIKQSKWLDQYTRCIFVEFTLFNPGTDLFISVVLAFEFDGTGGLFPFYAVSAARIYQDNARKEYWLQISEGITIICVIFYTIVEINAIIQQGIYDYLKSFWNWLEIAVLCLTYIIGIIYLFRLIAYLDAINIFRVYGHARFIDLQTVFFRDNVFNHCMGLLGALTIFKMLKVISFNPLLMTYTKTIHTIRADFAAYIAIVVVLLFAFSMFGTIIFGPYIFGYMSLDRALFNLMFFILKKTDFQNLVTVNRFLGRVFFLLGLVVTQYIIINFFIALLGEGLALVKHMSFQIENAALMHTLSILLPFIITPDNSKR